MFRPHVWRLLSSSVSLRSPQLVFGVKRGIAIGGASQQLCKVNSGYSHRLLGISSFSGSAATRLPWLPFCWHLRMAGYHPWHKGGGTTRTYSLNTEDVVQKVNEDIETQQSSKIFAVVHISGHQFKITTNDLIIINRIEADIGEQIYIEKVLLAGSENFTMVGTPLLSADLVRVKATVLEHSRTAKVIVFKKKRRKNYKRKRGHRQDVTVLRINSIHLSPNLN